MISDQSAVRVIIMTRRYERRPNHVGSTQRWLLAIGIVPLLLLPMIAMHFTDAVDWTPLILRRLRCFWAGVRSRMTWQRVGFAARKRAPSRLSL